MMFVCGHEGSQAKNQTQRVIWTERHWLSGCLETVPPLICMRHAVLTAREAPRRPLCLFSFLNLNHVRVGLAVIGYAHLGFVFHEFRKWVTHSTESRQSVMHISDANSMIDRPSLYTCALGKMYGEHMTRSRSPLFAEATTPLSLRSDVYVGSCRCILTAEHHE
jgi:hypothetical protein